MPDKRAKLLQDIVDASSAIQSFTQGRTFDEYGRDLMLRSAVERQFEIVGEALRRLLAIDAALAARISDQQTIIAFRNIIAHGYDVLDDRVVWGVIEEDVPPLIAEARALLDELQASNGQSRA